MKNGTKLILFGIGLVLFIVLFSYSYSGVEQKFQKNVIIRESMKSLFPAEGIDLVWIWTDETKKNYTTSNLEHSGN